MIEATNPIKLSNNNNQLTITDAISSTNILLAGVGRIVLPIDGSNFIWIGQIADTDLALGLSRIGINNYQAYIKESGINQRVLTDGVPRSKLVTTTHDLSVTGAQAITGAGFAPKAAIVFAVNSANQTSWGMTDGTTKVNITGQPTAGTFSYDLTNLIDITVSAGNFNIAALTSMDADGMTITWTKTGTPTGTLQIFIMFFR